MDYVEDHLKVAKLQKVISISETRPPTIVNIKQLRAESQRKMGGGNKQEGKPLPE